MNYNIDRKHAALFRKLAKKNATVIKRLRKLYHENVKDEYVVNGELSERDAEVLAKSHSVKMSPNGLCNYWIDYYDADANIFPKNAVKRFTDKEKFTLDIE